MSQQIIDKYIDRIKTDYPEDDKIQIDLEQFLQEMTNDDEYVKLAATRMHQNLCSELVDIARFHEGKKFEELDEYDRVKEIWALTKLLEDEYGIRSNSPI